MEIELLRSLNEGNLIQARLLLENGADPNHVLEEGGVAGVASMHMAAGLGPDALKLLLEFGGDPNVRSAEGVTPLHIAATWGELESVKLLLYNGGNPNLTDLEGLQAVDVAHQYNHEAVVCFLKYHALLLIPEEEEEDSQPRFTRESFDSNNDSECRSASSDLLNVSFVEDSSPNETSAARRSSIHTNTLQRKLAGCIQAGRHVCMDVTSPRHPFIEITSSPSCSGHGRHTPYQSYSCGHVRHVKHQGCGDLFAGGQHTEKWGNFGAERCGMDCSMYRCVDPLGVSYTDSDPEHWEGGQGDVLRHGVRDFHQNLVCRTRNPSNFGHQPVYNHIPNPCPCDNRLHHITQTYREDFSPSHHQSYLSRSGDTVTFHGYDSDDEACPQALKKIPSDPGIHTPQWTKLKDKVETSAEKVNRWQSSLHYSPTRFFAPLPDHQYNNQCPVGSPRELLTPESRTSKTAPRRSSMYTSNIQQKLDQHISNGDNVCFDVTSPGHPYIDFKEKTEVDSKVLSSPRNRVQNIQAGTVSPYAKNKRLSAVSSVSTSSCETFVTCDDSEFTLVTPLEPTLNSYTTHSGHSSDVVLNVKANCGKETNSADGQREKLSVHCQLSGNDVEDTECKVKVSESHARRKSNPTDVRQRSPRKHDRHPSHPKLDHELDLSDVRTCNGIKPVNKVTNTSAGQDRKSKVQTDIRKFSQWKAHVANTDLNVSDLITSDDSFIERKPKIQGRSCSNFKKKTPTNQKWIPPSIQELLDDTDIMTSDESFQIRERQKQEEEKDKITSLVDKFGKVSVKNRKLSPKKTDCKKRVSMDSLYSNASVREYLYKDKEKGITLLERYVPSECEEDTTRESLGSSCSTLTINSEDTEIYDWQDYQSDTDDGTKKTSQRITRSVPDASKRVSIPKHLSQLSNKDIRKKLESLGDDPGPVVASTRQTYLVRLATLEAEPTMMNRVKLSLNGPEYSPELSAALQGNFDIIGLDDLEDKMAASFQDTQGRCWREGTQKSSFNYLLLDPRVTRNLPHRAKTLGPGDTFKAFIHAIFYVGKGKRARPYCHLYEAISQMQKPKPKVSTKVQHILDIWQEGQGVVSLHIFQSVIPVEAYTREACMVEAFGLSKLTNMKRGDYYGVASTWPVSTKRKVGVHLLKKALQIFLSEGERQISPVDIKTS